MIGIYKSLDKKTTFLQVQVWKYDAGNILVEILSSSLSLFVTKAYNYF